MAESAANRKRWAGPACLASKDGVEDQPAQSPLRPVAGSTAIQLRTCEIGHTNKGAGTAGPRSLKLGAHTQGKKGSQGKKGPQGKRGGRAKRGRRAKKRWQRPRRRDVRAN